MRFNTTKKTGVSITTIILSVVFFVLLSVTLFTTPSERFAKLAELNYLLNKTNSAQYYSEKAFDLGNQDSVLREKYLNTLIKDDSLSVEVQEKLVQFIKYPSSDELGVLAENKLEDLREQLDELYPQNFIQQTVANQKVLRWNKFPITYAYQSSGSDNSVMKNEINKAFYQWQTQTDKAVQFKEVDNFDEADIKIVFAHNNDSERDSMNYIVAYTRYSVISDVLESMTINFYLKDATGVEFTPNQIYNTALHEIAHALGFMGHSSNKIDIMNSHSNARLHYENKRDMLSLGDINTIKLLYRIKPDITNHQDNNADYIPYVALGSDKEIVSAKYKESLAYIKKAPELPHGYMNLAEVYAQQKKYVKALKCLKLALNHAETSDAKELVYYNLAIISYRLENFEDSESYMRKSLAIKDSDDKRFFLAQVCIKEQDLLSAEEFLQKLVQNNPENIEYTISLVNMYVNSNQYLKARKTLKNYVKNNPQDAGNERLKSYGLLGLFL